MSLDEGRMSWNLDAPCRITVPPLFLPLFCHRDGVEFGFSSRGHVVMNICLSYESCEL